MSVKLPFCTKNLADGPRGVFESLQRTGSGEEKRKVLKAARGKLDFYSTLQPVTSALKTFQLLLHHHSFNVLLYNSVKHVCKWSAQAGRTP